MNKYSKIIISILFGGIIIFWACKHPIPEAYNPSNIPGQTGRACDSDSVYFANEILPLIKSSCAMPGLGCHDVKGIETDAYTNYSEIKQIVNTQNPSNSKLYKVIRETGKDRMPQSPQPALTAYQIARIKKWIDQGANENACDKCDTIDYKFSTAIWPIINLKCKGCHNPGSLGGNVDLSGYSVIKTVALNGKLYGTINWSAGFKQMPQGSYKLPLCEITQIKKWIDAGTLNN